MIAAYNVEQYIVKCLDSVVSQTLKSIEIIIVDDGSSDATPLIIKEYAKLYKKIKPLFNNTNKGAGYTKNRGISIAKGRYIGFVDSDDYIDPDYFKNLYNAAKKYQTDIACTDITLAYNNKLVESKLFKENMYINVEKIFIKSTNRPMLIPNEVAFAHWASAAAPTKLFKKQLLLLYPFFEGVCDDLPAVLPSITHAKKIVYVPNVCYYYFQRPGSLENSEFFKERLEVALVINETVSRIISGKRKATYIKILLVNNLYNVLIQIAELNNSANRLTFLKYFRSCLNIPDIEAMLDFSQNTYLNYVVQYESTGKQLYYNEFIKLFAKGEIEMANQLIDQWKDNKLSYRPKVSIIIPVYNGANYMRDAIGSALAQTYSNLEVIVINDGSQDNGETERIARSYGERIRYFYKENGGVASALNLGIEKMTGEYFSWLSHDDIYTCNKLERQLDILSRLTDKTVILTGGYSVIDAERNHLYDVDPLNLYPTETLENSVRPLLRGCIHGCAMLIHKSHFERAGIFNTNLPTTQDYDLFFRILRGQKIKFHDGLFVLSRCHDAQDSKKFEHSHIDECNKLWIDMMKALTDEEKCELEGSKYLFYHNIYEFLKNTTMYDEAIFYASNQAFDEARKELIKSNSKLSLSNRESLLRKAMYYTGVNETDLLFPLFKEVLETPKTRSRIAFFLGDINVLGGLNRVVLQIAGQLCMNYDVYLIFFEKASGKGYSYDSRLKEIIFPFGSSEEGYRDKLSKLLKLINVDIFVCSHNCSNVYLKLFSKLRQYGIKTIAWNHEFYFYPYRNTQFHECIPVKNEALAQADVSVWLNSFSANIYALLHPNGAIMANPITVDIHQFDNIPQRTKNIVAIGRFNDRHKGLAEILYTYSAVLKSYPDIELSIVGPYNLNATITSDSNITYEQLIKKLKLPEKQLQFTGWVKDVESYYSKAFVHLMPSRCEGFGLTITEAAAYGLPSIIFEGSGMEDIITNKVNGFIVPQGDVDAMATCVIKLIEDNKLLKAMSNEARLLAQQYKLPKIINRWEILINSVVTLKKDDLNKFLQKEFMFPVKDEKAFYGQIIKEYESYVTQLSTNRMAVYNSVPIAIQTENPYIAEVAAMQQSLSWRITKPLRWIRKIFVSLKRHGLRITLKKIIRKVKMKLQS